MVSQLENKNILILGFGVEGQSTYKFLRRLYPDKNIGIADQNPKLKLPHDPQLTFHLGPKYLQSIESYNLIIKSPGIPFNNRLEQLNKQDKLTSQTRLFFDFCSAKIIGVTGTKGKGTTSSLIYHIFKSAAQPVYLAGNIGAPVLDILEKVKKDDIVILELSSHQLEDLNKSPEVAVFLNLFPEHLDHFDNIESYGTAKANITKYQTKNDWLVYNADDSFCLKLATATRARKIAFSAKDFQPWMQNSPLIGRHNLYNVAAAACVAGIFNIESLTIHNAIKTYQPLPHRLEFAGNFKGINFYNDSQGTNPVAAIAALDSFESVATLICGGWDRGGVSYEQMGQKIAKTETIKTLILFPTTGKLIRKATARPIKTYFVTSMQKAVELAYANTPKGKICLLAPGSASFGIFKNYADRGDQFKSWVEKLGRY